MAKKQFKAESKRLLDLMINSIYTNREIFLRELISNASDALDKRHFYSLTNENNRINSDELKINIEIDKDNRKLILTDTGMGMTKEELETNLGTIAKSGSLDFKKELNEDINNVDIIGQFGVGFYSAFIVSKKVIVETKSASSENAYAWISEGNDGYSVEEIMKDSIGTKIILELKDNTEEENFDEFLESYTIKNLITKYSDYVRYPIQMLMEEYVPSDKEEEEGKTILELKTLNSMVPLWKKDKKDIKDEDYNEFYKSKFSDWTDPSKVIHYNIEGNVSYNGLLFIPSKTPFNFYNQDYKAGLQLYSKGVFILENAKDLIPEYFRFVKGIIDSNDLNLNISREILQQDRQLKAISKSIEKKVKSTLELMLKNEREAYETFFDNFGLNLKFGAYQEYGSHADTLKDLILFKSSFEDKYTTLAEYVSRMKEGQDKIYFVSGDNIDQIKRLPQLERVVDKGFEVLFLTDNVDEFTLQMIRQYDEKEFKSVTQGDLDLDTEEEKEEIKKQIEDNKSLLEAMNTSLESKVKEVRISSRLKSHPVCLVSEDGLSIEMEKVLKQNPDGKDIKATKILEINKDHDIFKSLQQAFEKDPSTVSSYTNVLYNQALLIEGLPIEDPIEYANSVCELMIKANK